MGSLTVVAQAAGLFLVTNIDDIIVLSLFFARGARTPHLTAKITIGQYLGFGAILAVSILATLGAASFLPAGAIPYFGMIPLGLGLWAAVRGGDDDDEGRSIGVVAVAAVTFANGGDNIGVYVPVFLAAGTASVIAYSIVFLVLIAVLVAAARFIATRKPIAEVLERFERVLFPLVLIILGVVILIQGGAFGL